MLNSKNFFYIRKVRTHLYCVDVTFPLHGNFTEELKNIKAEKDKVASELDDLKSQLVVAGLQLETNVETEKRKAAEEIASLQQLIQGKILLLFTI